jgi:pimeloyl-ACP methyl ester carboxylesterase
MPEFISSDGVRLHYDDAGTGTPVLALPGLTRNGKDFDYVAPYLKDVRLIRLDSRGRGQSDWADPATYTIAVEARDAVELLDHLELEKTAILGTSRGGLIAMALAATTKDRLSGVCLVDIGPELDIAGLDLIKGYIGHPPAAKTMAEAAVARATIFSDFRNVPEDRWLDEARKAYVETETGLDLNYDPALAGVFTASDGQPVPDLWPMFDALSGLPLALIRGESSSLLSAKTATEMQNRRPDMISATIPDRGHVPFLDEPGSVSVLRKWIGTLQ